ncbi:MAG TPA: succinate dehydrogenase assembly factor 2 [Candidatus Paenalcaligenes intestinipullorum]|uniref:FAD assembly factor SdhE n=1 Tax=Candidatus Paenalcaligenes intestinipullorum TaxID=2838718 RepID=A0A9D2RLI0_9BURK|nr:succinate dehydrogenase assembly factor 2 [Candidatus Paenalcaligenes intestinipullorum]
MATLTQLERARLRWRARRGLLENDLIITRFLDMHETQLTDQDVTALTHLFEMDDTELLGVLLGTEPLTGQYATTDIQRLVALMQEL